MQVIHVGDALFTLFDFLAIGIINVSHFNCGRTRALQNAGIERKFPPLIAANEINVQDLDSQPIAQGTGLFTQSPEALPNNINCSQTAGAKKAAAHRAAGAIARLNKHHLNDGLSGS